MIKAIIFDLDGVIVNSEAIWFQAIKEVCAEYGHEYTKEVAKKSMGSNAGLIIKKEFGITDSIDVLEKKLTDKYISLIEKNLNIVPGIFPLLEWTGKKYSLAVASSSPMNIINFVIDKLEIRKYFSFIISGLQVRHAKPEPDIFLVTAKNLAVEPHECLVIEDSPNGVKAAKAAKMKCIAINNIHTTEHDLKEAGADIIISSLDETTEKLLKDLP